MQPDYYLSIVIPAYNEQRRIGRTLARVQSYLDDQSYAYEVIVVDDGSKDGTGWLVAQQTSGLSNFIVLNNDLNRGKGYAVRRGILQARGKYIAFTDADLSTPIEEVEEALEWLNNGYDIVIGSRGLAGSCIEVHQPTYREKAARIFNLLVLLIVGLRGFKDTQCGFKVFRREVAQDIFRRQQIDGFMFDVETLCIAQRLGYRVKQMPVRWINDPDSRLRLVADTVRMFRDLVTIRLSLGQIRKSEDQRMWSSHER